MIINKTFLRKNRILKSNSDIYDFLISCDFCGKFFHKIGKNTASKFCSLSCLAKYRCKFNPTDFKKVSNSLKSFYSHNTVWNKGETKHTNSSLKKMSETMNAPDSYMRKVWKSIDFRNKMSLCHMGEKNGFFRKKHTKTTKENHSKIKADKIASGKLIIHGNSRFIKGWYFSEKNKEYFYYDSFWELLRMKILDSDNSVVKWTKKHKIKIPYLYKEIEKNYIPDFLITYENEKVLEEIKGSTEDEITKIKLSCLNNFCASNNLKSNVITFLEMEKLSIIYFKKSIKKLRREFKK